MVSTAAVILFFKPGMLTGCGGTNTVLHVTAKEVVTRGYVKDKVFVPPQPVSIPDLKNRITAAVKTITPDLLSRVWQELDYRLDVCRVTKGAYIEHL